MRAAPGPTASAGGHAERTRELDHEHRKRQLRGGLRLTLSMRYLATAFERLRRGTESVTVPSVAHPATGTLAVTFVGHATAMITTPKTRILTDPLLENSLYGIRRAKEAGIAEADLADLDLVVVTHAHRDHLSPKSLDRLPKAAALVVPPNCERLVRRLSFDDVVELEPGRSFKRDDVEIIAVPVRHSGARGFGDYARRGACGYVVKAPEACIYVAGDTGYFSGFVEIGRRFRPDVALLPISGYEPASFREEHLSPLDALYAFDDLGARILIPTSHGSFPLSYEPLDAPLAWLRQLAKERGLAQDKAAASASDRRLAILDHGETVFFRKT
jgi:L-ascorbate metabolism protein UlaG (beta-lactamase superfamily)